MHSLIRSDGVAAAVHRVLARDSNSGLADVSHSTNPHPLPATAVPDVPPAVVSFDQGREAGPGEAVPVTSQLPR